MFARSLDGKQTYKLDDGTEVIDLSESIFDKKRSVSQIYSLFKVSKTYEMRPDLISQTLYGSTDYTEMVMKYSLINNPFAVETNDVIHATSYDGIYNPVKTTQLDKTGAFDAIKNLHKYIDKEKVPDKVGSESVQKKIGKTPEEANVSKKGNSGLTVKNGKIYFGAIDETLTSVDSSIVDCATDGTTLGEFLNATIRNSM